MEVGNNMRKGKVKLSFWVPDSIYCNNSIALAKTAGYCRFCVIKQGSAECQLFNQDLYTKGSIVYKADKCNCSLKFITNEEVDFINVLPVDIKQLRKDTIDDYCKLYKELIKQGYTADMADKAVRLYLEVDNGKKL
jgi:hypothetical protein